MKQDWKNDLESLSVEELFELGVSVWNRLDVLLTDDNNSTEVEKKLLPELKAMQAEINAGRLATVSWEEVKQKLTPKS